MVGFAVLAAIKGVVDHEPGIGAVITFDGLRFGTAHAIGLAAGVVVDQVVDGNDVERVRVAHDRLPSSSRQ